MGIRDYIKNLLHNVFKSPQELEDHITKMEITKHGYNIHLSNDYGVTLDYLGDGTYEIGNLFAYDDLSDKAANSFEYYNLLDIDTLKAMYLRKKEKNDSGKYIDVRNNPNRPEDPYKDLYGFK